jgi:hypothetical protein
MVEVTREPKVVFDLLAAFGYRMFRESRQEVLNADDIDGNLFCLQPTDARVGIFAG